MLYYHIYVWVFVMQIRCCIVTFTSDWIFHVFFLNIWTLHSHPCHTAVETNGFVFTDFCLIFDFNIFCIFTLFSLLIISGFKFTVVDEFSHLGLGTVQNIWHQNLWNEHIHGQSLMDNHIYMLSINCWLESWSCSLFNFFFLKKKQLKND